MNFDYSESDCTMTFLFLLRGGFIGEFSSPLAALLPASFVSTSRLFPTPVLSTLFPSLSSLLLFRLRFAALDGAVDPGVEVFFTDNGVLP